jgi:DNA-binding NtrC family response regulator
MQVALELSAEGRSILWRPIDRAIFSVGRNPECDLCIPSDGVEPVQLLLSHDPTTLILKNRSAKGTQVAGEVVHGDLKLAAGDRIRLGPVEAVVQVVPDERGNERSGATRTLAEQPRQTPPAYLLTLAGSGSASRWSIDADGVTVGSDATNDIVLNDPYVSAFHARLWLERGRCLIRDLDSRNGVLVAGSEIREGEVPPGSQVQLGESVLCVHGRGRGSDVREDPLAAGGPLVGASEPMERLRDLIRRAAAASAPVLITGETGTGKEVVARIVAELTPTTGGPFITLNCGALSRNLSESELFGHERGAFTGAVARKEGAFEAADRGVLFLDEIGELPMELQPQLLRVIETGEVRRVGSTSSFSVQVRLIAATHRRLEHEVAVGRFREDLLHRLHVLVIDVPPLCDRAEDIPELTRHLLQRIAPAGRQIEIADGALDKLIAYDWPGNVRELGNALHRALFLGATDRIESSHITFMPSTLKSRVQSSFALRERTLQDVERDAFLLALLRHHGSKKDAAAALGVSRSTMHRKIIEHGIDLEALTEPG